MGKLTPKPKSPRYVEHYIDDDPRGAVIKDNATGEAILIIGTREQQLTVLRALNIADARM